jgi:hypothetical protein
VLAFDDTHAGQREFPVLAKVTAHAARALQRLDRSMDRDALARVFSKLTAAVAETHRASTPTPG